MATTRNLAFFAALAACLSTSCSDGGGAERASEAMSIVPEVVRTDTLRIPPNPTTGQSTPEEYQKGVFYRYRLRPGHAVRAILVLVPGTNGGANDFDYMARELIRLGRGAVEVWAFDRRPNLLEDLTGMEAAEAAHDSEIAIAYYWRGASAGGRKFEGFLTNDEVSYLSEWGLESVMRDVQAAIDLVPEANRKTNVFIGGHSLGAGQVMNYLGWDFDGNAKTLDDAGYNQVRGAILLEGGAFGAGAPESQSRYESSVEKIRSGASARFGGFPGLTPEVTALLELAGMVAHPAFDDPARADDGPAGISKLKEIPFGADVNVILNLIFAQNLADVVLDLPPRWTDFQVTHEAMLGLVLDNNFEPISAEQAGVGFVTPQTGVTPRELLGLPGYVLTDTGSLYGWLNFDQVGGIPLTTPEEEVTDIHRLAEVQWRGPSNFSEWYFALRPGIDSLATGELSNLSDRSWQATAYGLNLFHTSKIDVPILAVGGGAGLMPDPSRFDRVKAAIADPARGGVPRSSEEAFKVVIAPGNHHLDVLLAADEAPHANPVFREALAFMLDHAEGQVLVP